MKIQRVLLTFLLLLSVSVPCGGSELDEQIRKQHEQLRKVEKMSAFHSKGLARTRAKEQGYLNELGRLDRAIRVSEEQVRLLNLQIQKNEKELRRLTKELETREKNIIRSQALLNERLRTIYKHGGVAELDLLLSAGDAVELRSLTYMMGRIAESDRQMILKLQKERKALELSRQEVETNKAQLQERRKKVQREVQASKKAAGERQQLLNKVMADKKAHGVALRELEEDQKAIQRTINEYIARKAEEQRHLKEQGKPVVRGPVHKGRLAWPLEQREISSPFGMRFHPVFKTKAMHTGIDIRAPKGTPVKAAGDGLVLYAGWLRGYGQIVIIDHGKGISTVYAHQSQINVQEGDRVKTGTVIGRVGSSGVSTGPHLHFEVRIQGKAQNPLSYLPR